MVHPTHSITEQLLMLLNKNSLLSKASVISVEMNKLVV